MQSIEQFKDKQNDKTSLCTQNGIEYHNPNQNIRLFGLQKKTQLQIYQSIKRREKLNKQTF